MFPFLNHVQQGHAPADILLGYTDYQAQVSLGQVGLSLFPFRLDVVVAPPEKRFIPGPVPAGNPPR